MCTICRMLRLQFGVIEKRKIMRVRYFMETVVLASLFLFCGCTSTRDVSRNESDDSITITERPFQNYDQYAQTVIDGTDTSDNALGIYKPSVKIIVDNDNWDEKSINVRVNSVNVEEISISGIDYKEINDIYGGLNDDMTLKEDFVFVMANISLLCDESIDEANLSDFKIEFASNGDPYIAEKSYQSEKLYNDDPHRESIISLDANQEMTIDIGFVTPKQITESDNIQFIAAFQGMAVEKGDNPYEGAATFNLTSEIVNK